MKIAVGLFSIQIKSEKKIESSVLVSLSSSYKILDAESRIA